MAIGQENIVATESGFEPYGKAEVRTGMSVQEFIPISDYRASEAHPARGANRNVLCMT